MTRCIIKVSFSVTLTLATWFCTFFTFFVVLLQIVIFSLTDLHYVLWRKFIYIILFGKLSVLISLDTKHWLAFLKPLFCRVFVVSKFVKLGQRRYNMYIIMRCERWKAGSIRITQRNTSAFWTSRSHSLAQWADNVASTLNQRHWRWFNVATTSCVQWAAGL